MSILTRHPRLFSLCCLMCMLVATQSFAISGIVQDNREKITQFKSLVNKRMTLLTDLLDNLETRTQALEDDIDETQRKLNVLRTCNEKGMFMKPSESCQKMRIEGTEEELELTGYGCAFCTMSFSVEDFVSNYLIRNRVIEMTISTGFSATQRYALPLDLGDYTVENFGQGDTHYGTGSDKKVSGSCGYDKSAKKVTCSGNRSGGTTAMWAFSDFKLKYEKIKLVPVK